MSNKPPILSMPVVPIYLENMKPDTVTIKPIVVGQYMSLKEAQSHESNVKIYHTLAQIVNDCIVEPKDFDVKDYPLDVLEYIFTILNRESEDDTYHVDSSCSFCGYEEKKDLNKSDIQVIREHPKEKPVTTFKNIATIGTRTYTLIFEAPKLKDIIKALSLTKNKNISIEILGIIVALKAIIETDTETQEEEIYSDLDFSYKTDYINSFTPNILNKVAGQFVSRLPHVYGQWEVTCSDCKKDYSLRINDFLKP